MSEYDELVGKLRTYYGDDLACRMLLMDARHALEALAGEVERLKEERGAAITDRFDAAADRIKVVAAERDRLKAALQVIASDPTHSGQAMIARKALGGDAS